MRVIPGPDYMWSVDGHDKLKAFGIEIYAAIDAYSRKIIWIYVGRSNRTAISVVQQYLDKITDLGYQPLFLSSDKGSECTLLANAHHLIAQNREQQTTGDAGATLELRDCYVFGTSRKNHFIEKWWGHLKRMCLEPWLLYFEQLMNLNYFGSDSEVDKIAVLFIYIPIIRAEIASFVVYWDNHKIRKHRQKENHVPGAPDRLYYEAPQEQQYAQFFDAELVGELQSKFSLFGNMLILRITTS